MQQIVENKNWKGTNNKKIAIQEITAHSAVESTKPQRKGGRD